MIGSPIRGAVAPTTAISVKDFGAVGNGATDDTAAIQNAITIMSASGGGEIFFPKGVYKILGTLTGATKVSLRGVTGESILDFSSRVSYLSTLDDGLFVYRGSAGSGAARTDSTTTLTANGLIGDTTLTLTDTTGLAIGDLIELSAGATGPWIDTAVVCTVGQLVEITSVDSPTQITIYPTLQDDYNVADAASIKKVTPVEDITISGLTFIGKGRDVAVAGDIGLAIFYGKNISIRDCIFRGVDQRSIHIVSSWNWVIEDCTIEHDPKGANANVNYGVAYSSANTFGTVRRIFGRNMRHGIVSSHLSMALSYDYPGINRWITVEDCKLVNTWLGSIACHNDVEHLTIRGNHSTGCVYGINPRDKNVTIVNNTTVDCGTGIFFSGRPKTIIISGNTLTGGANAITFGSIYTGWTITDIAITNNIISRQTTSGVTFTDGGDGTGPHSGIVVSGNLLSGIAGAGNSAAIRIASKAAGIITNNVIRNCTIPAGIRLDYGEAMIVSGNQVHGIGTYGLVLVNTVDQPVIMSNVFATYGTAAINGATNAGAISGNIDFGSGAIS